MVQEDEKIGAYVNETVICTTNENGKWKQQ
jgi:hypothetical protein